MMIILDHKNLIIHIHQTLPMVITVMIQHRLKLVVRRIGIMERKMVHIICRIVMSLLVSVVRIHVTNMSLLRWNEFKEKKMISMNYRVKVKIYFNKRKRRIDSYIFVVSDSCPFCSSFHTHMHTFISSA